MNVRIKSSGNTLNDSEIENIATEETLSQILVHLTNVEKTINSVIGNFKNNKSSNVSATTPKEKDPTSLFNKIFNKLGGNADDKKSKAANILATATTNAATGLKNVTSGFSALMPEIAGVIEFAAILDAAAHILSAVFNTAGLLISTFISGKSAMSDFTAAIAKGTADIPIIGTFFSIINAIIGQVDIWNKALYDLNAVGASFNNSLSEMIIGAARAGMSLEDYAAVIKKNAAIFGEFGTVMQGVRIYTSIANRTMTEYIGRLTEMGISLEQYQQELPAILGLIGPAMKARGASDAQLTKSALDLTEQFDAMAKLTGQSREQQAAALQALQADAAWKIKMSQLTGPELLRQNKMLDEINTTMGPTAASLYKMHVLGIVPLSKDMQILQATVPGLGRNFDELSNAAHNGSMTTKQIDEKVADMLTSGINAGTGFQQVINAVSSGLDDATAGSLAKVQGELQMNAAAFKENGVFSKKLFLQKLEDARKEQGHGDAVRDALAKWNTDIKQLQVEFTLKVLAPLLDTLGPIITQIVQVFESADFQNVIKQMFEEMIQIVSDINTWVRANSSDIKTAITVIFKVIGFTFKTMLTIITWAVHHFEYIKVILVAVGVVIGAVGVALAILISPIVAVVGIFKILYDTIVWVCGLFGKQVNSTPAPASMANAGKTAIPDAKFNFAIPGGMNMPSMDELKPEKTEGSKVVEPQGVASTSVNLGDSNSNSSTEQTQLLQRIANLLNVGNEFHDKISKNTRQIAASVA